MLHRFQKLPDHHDQFGGLERFAQREPAREVGRGGGVGEGGEVQQRDSRAEVGECPRGVRDQQIHAANLEQLGGLGGNCTNYVMTLALQGSAQEASYKRVLDHHDFARICHMESRRTSDSRRPASLTTESYNYDWGRDSKRSIPPNESGEQLKCGEQ